ncbi:MAG: carboxymuconolactone decarboxylase family protein [Bacteroidales bacterium]|nr:carboxymuconolactone decarboxylase family protein [Bacteroidales bacterium]
MKKHFITFASIVITILSCSPKTETKSEKDMNTLSFNSEQAACMTAIACYEAKGDQDALSFAINEGFDAGLTVSQIKEAMSQLYAYTGFPRSLNALGTLQKVIEEREKKGAKTELGTDASPLPSGYNALKQGTEIQTQLSGKPFDYEFSPAEDYYLKAHLFGDIFVRDNLTYADRELITVSALAGLEGVEPQLAAHVNGARNMGLTDDQLLSIPQALKDNVGKMEAHRVAEAIQQLGINDSTNNVMANELFIRDYVDIKSSWRIGNPNTAYSQYFIGRSFLSSYGDDITNVSFEPRCRNNWHIHHNHVQVIVCVYGRGWYQEWGKPAVELHEGVIIEIPEGVKHWHGAAKSSWMQHLTYYKETQPDASTEWLEPVTDEVYDKLK